MIPAMKTIAFITAKGGPGKSTLAASVAVAAQESGEKVFLIDLDPQESLYKWGQRREADEPAVDKITAEKLQAAIAGIKNAGYTLAIIDTAGVDVAANSAAMAVADLCLVPSRPSQLDIEAAKPTVSSLLRMKRKFAFVLNQCPAGRTLRPNDASRALAMMGGLALPFIGQRADHMDAIAVGQGVTERDPHGKAADEIRQLWGWIKNQMEKKTNGQETRVA